MNPKPRPNHRLYIQSLRRMTPEQRLNKAFELTEYSKAIFVEGLRRRFPRLADAEFHELMLQRLEKCHNRNF